MACVPLCGSKAIVRAGKRCAIDEDLCVECYLCLRSGICPEDAFDEIRLTWPRILRHTLSSVQPVQEGSGLIEGRGTAEMKTNDVTDRYRAGEVGFTVDVGRPGIGAIFEDVEKIAVSVARLGVEFEKENPITRLMTDGVSGIFRNDVKKERVLSCILEFKTDESLSLSVIEALRDIATEVNTVFSVGCISRCRADGTAPVRDILDSSGVFYRKNGKVNIGLGRVKK